VNEGESEAATRREIAAVALALLALIAAVLWLTRGAILFTRPLWVDEWFTVLVASHPSPVDVVADLKHGADGGPSLIHLIVWALRAVAGPPSPTLLRAMSLIFVWSALCVVYVVVRRRFSPSASIAGVLAVGSHELVVAHAFEARFYALWLVCCALYAWSLGAQRHRNVKIAMAAIVLVTSHWFGIVTLGLMASAIVLSRGRRWRDGVRLVAPSVAGLVALVAVWPLMAGQRAAMTVNSWIPDTTAPRLSGLSSAYWTATVPLLAAAALAVAAAIAWRRDRGRALPALAAPARSALDEAGVAALASLALMPIVLVAMAFFGQPWVLGRYAISAALAWAPFVAYAMTLLGRWPARVFALILTGFWFVSFRAEVRRKSAFAIGVRQEGNLLRHAMALGLPVVFQSLHTMYPQVAERRAWGAAVRYLALPDSTFDALFPPGTSAFQSSKAARLERDFARVHAMRFGFPLLATQAELDTLTRFLLLATPVRLGNGADGVTALAAAAFPRHRVVPLEENLLLLERPAARSLPARSTSR
jgi:hypothetical protein